MSSLTPVVVGVDVGGTNTDAVALKKVDEHVEVVAAVKKLTTTDVTTGVRNAVLAVLKQASEKVPISVTQVNIGTTHFVNAVVQGRGLTKVSVIRLCGTTSRALPPFCEFSSALKDMICGSVHLIAGGYRYDGKEIDSFDPIEISNTIDEIRDTGITNVVVSCVFANVRSDQEHAVQKMIHEFYPEASVTLSHWIDQVGLLGRENAAILNECLKYICKETITGLQDVLLQIGVNCPIFLTQNNGTIISSADAMQFPVRAFLSNVKDVNIVRTDEGVLANHSPRCFSTNVHGASYVSDVNNDNNKTTSVTMEPGSGDLELQAFSLGSCVDDSSGHLAVGLKKTTEFQDSVVKKIFEQVENRLEGAGGKMSTIGMPAVGVGEASCLFKNVKYSNVAGAIRAALGHEKQVVDRALDSKDVDTSKVFLRCEDLLTKVSPLCTKNSSRHIEETGVHTETKDTVLGCKQYTTFTGNNIDDKSALRPLEPFVDSESGEWIISEYDIEAFAIGIGILGCGGGGNPQIGRLRALEAIRKGKKLSVVSAEMLYKEAAPGKKYVASVGFMGVPVVVLEQLVSSTETTAALKELSRIYRSDGHIASLLSNDDVIHQKKDMNVIRGSTTNSNEVENIAALMSVEIGGLNAIEPLLVSADLGIPVIDSDGMGRAFPELQMFCPFIYGLPAYPAVVASDEGTSVAVLRAESAKSLENQLREIIVKMGGAAGIAFPLLDQTDVMNHTVLHSVSRAWRLGDAILRSRYENRSPITAILDTERSLHVLTGKIKAVTSDTKEGFDRGQIIVEGADDFSGQRVLVEFKNENLIIFPLDENKERGREIACVPDLIAIVDADTAQPIPTQEVKYGMRVAVLVLAAPDLLKTEQALKYVGPKAFDYDDVTYVSIGEAFPVSPIPKQTL